MFLNKKATRMSQGEKPAYQKRSRIAREKIVTALDSALRERPFDQVTVADIAQRAGVAVGTVYRRFENKDALIPVVMEIYEHRLEEWAAGEGAVQIDEDDDLRSALQKMMRQAWRLLTREAHLLRAVHLYARLKPELIPESDWDKYNKAAVQGMKALISHYADQVVRKNSKRTSAFAAYVLNSIFIEKGLYPNESPALLFPYKGDTFADECADMLFAYLQVPET